MDRLCHGFSHPLQAAFCTLSSQDDASPSSPRRHLYVLYLVTERLNPGVSMTTVLQIYTNDTNKELNCYFVSMPINASGIITLRIINYGHDA